jgi:hypothetical protein
MKFAGSTLYTLARFIDMAAVSEVAHIDIKKPQQ